ncbi:transcriptional regulator BetI [Mesorhizobium sp. B2-4-14]|nr:transcriptional regulator BetI [Mesorhizobium sp. B2-4-17]TPL10208.1 transcriptional regulator BetI [Mesorhizobium sp. B2-4-14]
MQDGANRREPMPKVGMQPIRQKQIIEAAIDTIHELGIEQSSIRQIGMKAGISPSLITHYFGSRDELYTLVLRHLNRELSRVTIARLRTASTPMERLLAIASAQFDAEQFQPAVATAWFALWAALRGNHEMMRYQAIYEKRLASNIAYCLRSLIPEGQVDFAVNCLLAMIDGLWVKAAQPTSRVTTENALAIFQNYVVQLVSQLARGGAE